MQFRNEFLRDGALSSNCCLFFRKVLQCVSVLHKRRIAHNDIKWSNILLVKEWLPGESCNIVLGDFGNSLCYSKGTQYVTVSPANPTAHASIGSRRAEQCLRKAMQQDALRQPAASVLANKSSAKQGLKQAVKKRRGEAVTVTKRKPVNLLTQVTEAMLKDIMDRDQLLLLSAGSMGYRNVVMVKLSNQRRKKASTIDKPQVEFVDACNHDVRSVAAMLCEVMHGKSDNARGKGKQCYLRQYELELDKLKTLQEVSDFLLQRNSVPICDASQQTKLLCKLVNGMLRSDTSQLTAEAAAKHNFFAVVLGAGTI